MGLGDSDCGNSWHASTRIGDLPEGFLGDRTVLWRVMPQVGNWKVFGVRVEVRSDERLHGCQTRLQHQLSMMTTDGALSTASEESMNPYVRMKRWRWWMANWSWMC